MNTLANIAGLMIALILTMSGLGHLFRIGDLRDALARQGVWPVASLGFLPTLVATLEAGLGLVTMLSILKVVHLSSTGIFGACCGLLVSYALFGVFLLRTRPGAPCGCSALSDRTNGWIVLRAIVLALLALVAAAVPPESFLDLPMPQGSTVLAAGIALSTLIWEFPAAMARLDEELIHHVV